MLDQTDIDIALNTLREIKEESIKDKRYGFEDEWEIFIKKMQFLSPKSFGTHIQNRIIEKNEFTKTNASDDKGDFESKGDLFEFKTSILTTSNTKANFVNIRPYQAIHGYYLLVIDTNSSPYQTFQFKMTKEQMSFELEMLHANYSNGTKSSNQLNINASFRFSIDFAIENETKKRWIREYLIDTLKL